MRQRQLNVIRIAKMTIYIIYLNRFGSDEYIYIGLYFFLDERQIQISLERTSGLES